MHDHAGTVIGGSHDSSSPQTPRSIRPEMTGSSLRMSSNRIFGAAQSRPMIITRLAVVTGGGIELAARQLPVELDAAVGLARWLGHSHDHLAVAVAVARAADSRPAAACTTAAAAVASTSRSGTISAPSPWSISSWIAGRSDSTTGSRAAIASSSEVGRPGVGRGHRDGELAAGEHQRHLVLGEAAEVHRVGDAQLLGLLAQARRSRRRRP